MLQILGEGFILRTFHLQVLHYTVSERCSGIPVGITATKKDIYIPTVSQSVDVCSSVCHVLPTPLQSKKNY